MRVSKIVKKNTDSTMLNKPKKYAKNDTSYSSLWLFCGKSEYAKPEYRDYFTTFYDEKNTLSEFNPIYAKNIINFWSEPKDKILDPFAGRTRCVMANALDREYHGYDVSKDVTTYLKDRLKTLKIKNNVNIINKDCINIASDYKDNSFDLVFTCPPYWNLEKYESCPGQLSDINNYNIFLNMLYERLTIAAKKLKPGKFFCMVVGDMRKQNNYIPFFTDIVQIMKNNKNLKIHDIISMQNIPFNTAAFYFGSKKKHKYTAKAHEYLIVWKKISKTS